MGSHERIARPLSFFDAPIAGNFAGMFPEAIGPLDERNIPGACRFDIILADDIETFPDVVFGRLPDTIALKTDKYWTTIYFIDDTQGFDEQWGEDGAAAASLGGEIAKDTIHLLELLWNLRTERFVCLQHDRNHTIKVIGSKEEPARLRTTSVQHGKQKRSDGNKYFLLAELLRNEPCPFYLGEAPDPGSPGGGGVGGMMTPIAGTEGTLGTEDTANMDIVV